MAEAQDVEALKRRGRRRLVGAVALVLAAIIVLPMVFDNEPRPGPSNVSVRIPGEGEASFRANVPPPSPPPARAAPVSAPKAAPAAEPKKTAPVAEPKPKAAAASKAPARAPAKKPATEYIFQVGVFANPENVMATLKSAKVPYYTEPARGKLTRVRAGPFASREAAEKALAQLKKLGLEPGAVMTRG